MFTVCSIKSCVFILEAQYIVFGHRTAGASMSTSNKNMFDDTAAQRFRYSTEIVRMRFVSYWRTYAIALIIVPETVH